MCNLQEVLQEKFDYTEQEALDEIEEGKKVLNSYLEQNDLFNAWEVCNELWGLEPDYLMDLVE